MTKHFSQVTSVLALAVGAAVMMTCTATHYSAAEGERATNGTAAKAPAASAQAAPVNREALPFYNAKLPLDQRVDDLIKRLTVVEKAGLMCMASPAIPRLGISQYHWWNEALHGVARNGTATVFPQAIGMAATWDTDLHLKMAQTIATESRAKHNETLHTARQGAQYTGLDQWSPNINIFRDPRWGRGQETYGEDPYLTGRFGISFVKGLQGDDPKYFENIATPKHYAVHSGPEPERHRVNVEPTEQDLYTTYLPAFEATVREAHAYSVMASYNSV